jgi:hypothetical protein
MSLNAAILFVNRERIWNRVVSDQDLVDRTTLSALAVNGTLGGNNIYDEV